MLTITLTARFILELGALVALGSWGFAVADGTPTRLALGIGLPLAVAAVWGAFIGPGAPTSGHPQHLAGHPVHRGRHRRRGPHDRPGGLT